MVPDVSGQAALPDWHRKGVAVAAPGSGVRPVIPDGFRRGCSGGWVGGEPGAAAGQCVRAGGWKVRVVFAVCCSVGAAVVTCRRGDGHPECRGVGEGLVEGGACLGGPCVLVLTPTDADRG